MNSITLIRIIELTARMLEFVGVAVIGISFVYAGFRGLRDYLQKKPDAYGGVKIFIGRGLQLGLEFLVAADVISTVTVEPTMEKILALGLLIVVRTLLSWSIAVEVEGCWPWQVAKKRKV
jgi:uncharacterized membrane protein